MSYSIPDTVTTKGPFQPMRFEATVEECIVTHGEIPKDLSGGFYRTGPCWKRPGAQGTTPLLAMDGMVQGLVFENGRADFRNRWVRTPKYELEDKYGRGMFDYSDGGFGDYRDYGLGEVARTSENAHTPQGTASINIFPFGGDLVVSGEYGCPPQIIDPITLETKGIVPWAPALSKGPHEPVCFGDGTFCAHPKWDEDTGVLYGYRTIDDDLPLIRGRIRTTDQMRRTGLPLPVALRYDDHTPDIPENQILLTALLKMERLPGCAPGTRLLLRHLAARLSSVQPLAPRDPLPTWTPTRLNARYLPALRLCELLLADRTLRPEGTMGTRNEGFLLDMPRVFEKFLEVALGQALRSRGVRCTPQETQHRLDQAGHVHLRPDLVLYQGGRTRTVVDAKYKDLRTAAPPTEHMYQLLSYCTALGLTTGHLVYAGGGSTETAVHHVRGSGISIRAHTLDLSQSTNALLASISTLAESLVSGVGE